MGCKFIINHSGNLDSLFRLAMQEIKHFDGQFSGSKNGGNFVINALGGRFEGRFLVRGNIVEWEINKKPFFITCSMIETFLTNQIN